MMPQIIFVDATGAEIDRWEGAIPPSVDDQVWLLGSVAAWYRVVARSWWHRGRVHIGVKAVPLCDGLPPPATGGQQSESEQETPWWAWGAWGAWPTENGSYCMEVRGGGVYITCQTSGEWDFDFKQWEGVDAANARFAPIRQTPEQMAEAQEILRHIVASSEGDLASTRWLARRGREDGRAPAAWAAVVTAAMLANEGCEDK